MSTDNGNYLCKDLKEKLPLIRKIVMSIQGNDPAHGWPHTMRVLSIAREITERGELEPNPYVLEASILLHDVGRGLPGNKPHAIKSASFAENLLTLLGVDKSCIEVIVHAIRAHSFSLGEKARTLEAMILSDADKIDALGAIGIARVFHTGCMLGRSFEESIQHFYDKILELRGILYLEPSRNIADDRVKIIEYFLNTWNNEYKILKIKDY